ncbi:hypothetical protein [Kocuria sp. U4B]
MTAAIVQAVMMTLVTVYLVVSAAASGRLPGNRRIGLRTSASLSSPMAWRAGHAVALRRLRWSALAGVTGAGLLLRNLRLTGSDRAGFLPRGLLPMMLVTIFQAAARGGAGPLRWWRPPPVNPGRGGQAAPVQHRRPERLEDLARPRRSWWVLGGRAVPPGS